MSASPFDIAIYSDWDKWIVNGEAAPKETCEFLEAQTHVLDLENWGHSSCPHCRTVLTQKKFEDTTDGNEVWHNNRTHVFKRCSHCAHWEYYSHEGGNKCMDGQHLAMLSAVVARFSKDFPDSCSQELAQHLRRNPSYWHQINPKQLEKLVAEVFRANYHDAETIHVGKPFDEGIDVIFIESNGTRWLVQVKRREHPNRAEGFATLQSILGALALDGARHGIVVSTADSFSYYARRARKRAEQKGFVVEFIDKGILARMIDPLLPETPWAHIFSCPALSHVEEDVKRHFCRPESTAQSRLKGF